MSGVRDNFMREFFILFVYENRINVHNLDRIYLQRCALTLSIVISKCKFYDDESIKIFQNLKLERWELLWVNGNVLEIAKVQPMGGRGHRLAFNCNAAMRVSNQGLILRQCCRPKNEFYCRRCIMANNNDLTNIFMILEFNKMVLGSDQKNKNPETKAK